MKIRAFALWASAALSLSAAAATPEQAAQAVNALGLDLHRQMPKEGNLCLSPYSIQCALAMTYLGASGVTQEEMARVLHFTADKEAVGESFTALKAALNDVQATSLRTVIAARKWSGPQDAVTLRVVNRLFGREDYEFRQPFLASVQKHFDAPLQPMKFREDPEGARLSINGWVAQQTQKRILDLIPYQALTADTRLVLVNALYFKAAWEDEFPERLTSPAPFHAAGGKETVMVPMMTKQEDMFYHKGEDFQAVMLRYVGNRLHFLLIVPDNINGVASVEEKLTPEVLLACVSAKSRKVDLHLPKFKITPPTIPLGKCCKRWA